MTASLSHVLSWDITFPLSVASRLCTETSIDPCISIYRKRLRQQQQLVLLLLILALTIVTVYMTGSRRLAGHETIELHVIWTVASRQILLLMRSSGSVTLLTVITGSRGEDQLRPGVIGSNTRQSFIVVDNIRINIQRVRMRGGITCTVLKQGRGTLCWMWRSQSDGCGESSHVVCDSVQFISPFQQKSKSKVVAIFNMPWRRMEKGRYER
jgi:hypothetical protein